MIATNYKIDSFQKEIRYLKNPDYQADFQFLVSELPDYFFEVAASSTGKYHPSFSLGKGGLLRHSKVAVRIGYELLNDPCIGDKYTDREKDLFLIALAIHDGVKHGIPKEEYTRADHPLLACQFIQERKKQLRMNEKDSEFLCHVIASHMGPWNTHPYTKEEILPKPKDKYQNFVHLCDYLASRKFLEVKFQENEIED